MRILRSSLMVSLVCLTACGAVRESRVNPFNWFGQGRSEPVETQAAKQVKEENPLIPERTGIFEKKRERDSIYLGTPIARVTELVVERVPGGAIVRAKGVSAAQGVYGVQLTPENEDLIPQDGVLSFRFEGLKPTEPTAVGTEASRTIVAAIDLTNQELDGVRNIRIIAANNAMTSSRR